MEPSRGLKRKRKAEAKVEENGLATSPLSQPLPLDWWDDFSKRITGMKICNARLLQGLKTGNVLNFQLAIDDVFLYLATCSAVASVYSISPFTCLYEVIFDLEFESSMAKGNFCNAAAACCLIKFGKSFEDIVLWML
ncbi:hypothetical protein CK203_010283 [Vitis vinifera]|uniref:Uncharacterized protein n=1 Tax=Vitis vinifera TaxID=29760 RepID=A0A438JY64_VITVI|nr:hypothetical protein CK203_010283 [Vitis vinifera]